VKRERCVIGLPVQAYDPSLPEQAVPIVNAVTVYDCPTTGRPILCQINEALHMPHLDFSLICPNQLRDMGHHVDETPRQYCPDSIFGIYLPEQDTHIPFDLQGVISGFDTRPPTDAELYMVEDHVALTSPVAWDPQHPDLSIAEEEMGVADSDDILKRVNVNRQANHERMKSQRLSAVNDRNDLDRRIISLLSDSRKHSELREINDIEKRFRDLWSGENETEVEVEEPNKVFAIRVGEESQEINSDNLAKKGLIGKEAAKQTLNTTTQLGIRRLTTPAARRFRTQMKHLRYPTLPGTWYADTMHLSTKSINNQLHAHVIGNGKGYSKFFPMETKNETHHSLDDFIKKVGAPEYLLTDNDPTMRVGKNGRNVSVNTESHHSTPNHTLHTRIVRKLTFES